MKANLIVILTIATITNSAWSAEPAKGTERLPLLNVETNIAAGYRLLGEQLTVARDSLTITPDYYLSYFYGGRLTIMPSHWGLQASFIRNIFRAASWSAGGGYSVYTYDTLEGGVAYAIPLSESLSDSSRRFLIFGAGLNYSMLQLADQFKSDLQASASKQGRTLTFNPDDATGIGGYLQGGVFFYLNDHIFFSGSLKINHINARFSEAGKPLDSWGLEIPLGIGVAF